MSSPPSSPPAATRQNNGFARLVGTRETARDLEAIRRALGEPTVSYLGFSYGTLLGIVYAQMFPHSVRALVLDGAADWWLPTVQYAHAQAEGFFQALDAFLSWCDDTSSCALAGRVHRGRSSPAS